MIKHFSLLIFLVYSITAHANGIIRGIIIDSNNAEPLFAASAGIDGTTIGATSDFDGQFELNVKQGFYTLKISYIGYQPIIISNVEVKEGRVTNLSTIRLNPTAIAIETVTITAEATRNTESALLTIKKKSVNVIDGITSQSFKKMGDGNAASAVTRVPGVSVQGGKYVYVRGLGDRYTKTTFNGLDIPGLDPDRNALQMDIFPTNIVDNIIVSKSFTADLPADFSGGVVDINIKSFPEVASFKSSIGINYNSQVDLNGDFLTYYGGKTDFLAFDHTNRVFPLANTVLDVQNVQDPRINPETMPKTLLFNSIMGTLRGEEYFSKNSFFKIYNTLTNGSPMNFNAANFSLSGGNQFTVGEKTFGYSGALSYKNSFSYYNEKIQNHYQKSADPSIYDLFSSKTQVGDIGKNSALMSATLGGALKFNNSKYKINALHLQNAEKQSGYFFQNNYESNFNTVKKENLDFSVRSISNLLISGNHYLQKGKTIVEWKLSPTYSKIRDKDVRESAYEVDINNGDTTYSFSPSGAGYPSRMWRNLNEYNIASRLDISKEYQLFDREAKIKVGVGYTYKKRDYDILRYVVYPINYGYNTYSGNPNELLTDFIYNPNTNSGFYIGGEYQASNAYEGVQSNLSVYISEELEISDQLKTIIGLRIEDYKQYYTGVNQNKTRWYNNELVLSDYTMLASHKIPLGLYPSLSAIYNLNKKSILRGSFFRTTARPSFKEKSNAQILDVLSGITFNGNIDLVSTSIINYDLRFESYFDKGETLAISAFLKDLTNPIEMVAYTADEDNIQPINSGNAQIMGIEVEGRKNLNALTNGLSAVFNASYIHSEVQIVGDEYLSRKNNLREGEAFQETRVMQGQAPYLINAGVSYKNENTKLEAGLFYNVQGPSLAIVGINNRPDVYNAPFNSLNLNLLYSVSKKSQITFSVKNLLNDRNEMLTESFGTDPQIYSSYQIGRTLAFKWTYTFL